MQEALVGLEAISDGRTRDRGADHPRGIDEATLGAPPQPGECGRQRRPAWGLDRTRRHHRCRGAGSISVAVTLSKPPGCQQRSASPPGARQRWARTTRPIRSRSCSHPGRRSHGLVNVWTTRCEEGESVTLVLGPPAGASSGSTLFSLDITDDDPQPSLSLSSPGPSCWRQPGACPDPRSLRPAGLDVTAELLVGGTERGANHDLTGQTSSFLRAPPLPVPFSVIDDALDEELESLTASLASIGGAADGVIARPSRTMTKICSSASAGREGMILECGAQVVTVLPDAPSGRPVTVAISVDAVSTVSSTTSI